MTQHKFAKLVISRDSETETYTIHGYEKIGHDPTVIEATYLSVNGVGFACNGAEFSQHKTTITVEQQTEGGSANIIVDSSN